MASFGKVGEGGGTDDVGDVDVGITMPGEEPVRHVVLRLIRL